MARRKKDDAELENEVQAALKVLRGQAPMPAPIHNWIEIPNTQLRAGHHIVTQFSKDGNRALKFSEVRTIEHCVRGCRNIHVNKNDCYDVAGRVAVRV